jgi:hypothetical protein
VANNIAPHLFVESGPGQEPAEEHAVTLMREYHTAKWEEMPEAEIERRRVVYLSFVGGTGHDPLRDES